MIDKERRGFFKKVVMAGAVLAASGEVLSYREAAASTYPAIKGVCLLVPNLEMGAEFAEQMKQSAHGTWQVHILNGSVTDFYFETKTLYEEAKSKANTFVGVADPATFAAIREAIGDSGGNFHYITYEDPNRVSFSVRL
jgi:hypothetical protein